MKYSVYFLLLLFIVPCVQAENSQTVKPEVHTKVQLSSTDLNRMHCEGPIKDVIASEEKGIITKIIGNDVYIKYKVLMTDSGLEKYTIKRNDVYIICNDETYSLIIEPKQISGQTIRLVGMTKNVSKNKELFSGKDIEQIYGYILKAAYLDDLPDSFVVKNSKATSPIPYFRDFDIRKRRDIRVEGEGLILNEYIIKSRVDAELIEQDFLIKGLAKQPVFISVEPRKVKKGSTSRLFIIQKSNS